MVRRLTWENFWLFGDSVSLAIKEFEKILYWDSSFAIAQVFSYPKTNEGKNVNFDLFPFGPMLKVRPTYTRKSVPCTEVSELHYF